MRKFQEEIFLLKTGGFAVNSKKVIIPCWLGLRTWICQFWWRIRSRGWLRTKVRWHQRPQRTGLWDCQEGFFIEFGEHRLEMVMQDADKLSMLIRTLQSLELCGFSNWACIRTQGALAMWHIPGPLPEFLIEEVWLDPDTIRRCTYKLPHGIHGPGVSTGEWLLQVSLSQRLLFPRIPWSTC